MLLKRSKGFTLIETIIYIALFSLIIGGLIATAFYLYQNATTTSNKISAQTEINFVLKKLEWALTSAECDSVSASSSQISFDNPGSTTISYDSGDKKLELDGQPITTVNVEVENVSFSDCGADKLVTISFEIDGIPTTFTKILKL